MAVSPWLLTSVLFLLPFMTQVSAQQPGCSVSDTSPNVNENNPPGYVVATINTEPGFTVRISPSSSDGNFFAIVGSELQLTQSVDYEDTTVLLVTLICENAVGQTHNLEIQVNILNLNDNSPVFARGNLTVFVPEDTKVNTTIVALEEVSASDADLDTIYYELATKVEGTDGYFAIKGVNNPAIYLQKALDYEKFNLTTLVLYARDRPVDSSELTNTATATINVHIEQADTKSPWFKPCSFINTTKSICINSGYTGTVNIYETPTKPLVLQPGPIYAVDPDYLINEKIKYSIVGGNKDNVFSIDEDTGNLTMKNAATSFDTYVLQVMAAQVNNIQKYSVARVDIKVVSKNNHPPYFKTKIYNGTVFAGLASKSFVFQAENPSTPLVITAEDDDFTDKVNPGIEYYIKNSTDFIATKDGLILTNVMLESPKTVTIEAVGRDTVSMEEASTVIVVEVLPAAGVTASNKIHTAQDMAILGGTLAALLLIALIFLGVMVYKQYGEPVKRLIRKKFSKDTFGDYQNQSYEHDEYENVSTKQHETSENGTYRSMTHVPEQPALFLPSSNAVETDSVPKTSIASTIIFDQEEKEDKMEETEEEIEHEKEVKSILKTDRHAGNDGYKAVWFKTDVDPDAGETVEVIEDNAADGDNDNGDNDSDQDLQTNDNEEEEEEEDDDYDKDDHHRGLGVSFAPGSSSPPAAEVKVDMSHTDAETEDDSYI
ncbi:PREDICTED: cadherin-related family member 5 [Calidris pugnax]|uniref:cadherin-related family member 5 n=1 Tax=Calidris pugnax TaxID=198806 RepID=UPI00071D6430|nr:PREDICTED: cadherin-related family member 5 [Calidris pugnax]